VGKNVEGCPKVSQGVSKGMEGASYSHRLALELEKADIEGTRRRLPVRDERVDGAAVSVARSVLCQNLNQ
jgi:hypothetical protein